MRVREVELKELLEIEEELAKRNEIKFVSQSDLIAYIGQRHAVDHVLFADATACSTTYEYFLTPGDRILANLLFFSALGRSAEVAREMQARANSRESPPPPEDYSKYVVVAHHSVGVTLRAVNVATGRIDWIGYRQLAAYWPFHAGDDATVFMNFTAAKRVTDSLVADVLVNESVPSNAGVVQVHDAAIRTSNGDAPCAQVAR